ncbi:MAG: IspD/TarI family cytidylyltransferase [Anaeroplasmataceae bacterium]
MISVIIVMAGNGTRLGLKCNKALVKLGKKPIFLYSYEKFKSLGFKIILSVCKTDIDEVRKLVDEDTIIVEGGVDRAHSVYNGLLACDTKTVLIHDAARVFTSPAIIKKVVAKLTLDNAVLVKTDIKDTVREINGQSKIIDRAKLIAAQTPQACNRDSLLQAYDIAFLNNDKIFDDISVIEKYTKLKIEYVDGDELNFKITTPNDIIIAENLIEVCVRACSKND